jgi:hypothetical protein
MAGKKRKKVREKDVEGIKYFDKLTPLLERLHDVGCQRDSAGNRRLHMDQYCSLVLLFLFNPICSSLRAIQQASELKKVQRKLGCPRASLGSLSESVGVFEPERLKEIIRELGEQLAPIAKDSRLKDVKHTITLVDGSLLKVLPWLSQSMLQKPTDEHKIRLHAHFEVDRYVPTRIDVTAGTSRGKDNERAVMLDSIEQYRLYVMDRGYVMFKLFNEIVAAGSSYVCRVRDNSSPEVIERRPLGDEDIEADVLDDIIGRFGKTSRQDARPDHPMRMVTIKTTPHVKRGKYKGGSTGPGSDGVMRIVTDMLDAPAWVIGLIYRYRWTIEVFFRFFKHILGCRHLLSTKREGIEIQTYMAIIACMLISLWTGRKPTLRTYEMICYYFIGWADEEELLAHIAKLKPHTP